MARQAIRLQGAKAEAHFIRLIPGARASDNAKRGDAIVTVGDSAHYVEIKECHAPANKSGTINQVRAIKYICCIIWAPERKCWYVISPDQLVAIAASKGRGQHTEIPFECMNLGLNSLNSDVCAICADVDLAKTVESAIQRGERMTSVKKQMGELLRELRALGRKHKDAAVEHLR